ncbi:hypothetical protein ACOSQ2_014585 [Xanthoceras sorbifolium]
MIGHLLRECHTNDWGLFDGLDVKFGAWLRAPVIDRLRGCGDRFEKPGMRAESEGQEAGPVHKGAATNLMVSYVASDCILSGGFVSIVSSTGVQETGPEP